MRRRVCALTLARFGSGGERALVRGKVRTPLNAPERLALELVARLRPLAPRWQRLTRLVLLLGALASVGLSGCTSFWDDVTSRDFEFRSLWVKPDPLVVLRDSKDGDQRAKAFRLLHEPAQFGEPQDKQDVVVQILCTAVVKERTALCRQAAIATLRTFKDPRASKALQDAYYAASVDYPAATSSILQCQAIEALGQVGNPDAVQFLLTVLKEPPVAKSPDSDRQQLLEQRIAAARALGHFKQFQAAESLLAVLKTEKDPGLRNGAHASLELATGKRFPEDAQVWDQYLHSKQDKDAIFGEPSITDQFWDVVNVSWWK